MAPEVTNDRIIDTMHANDPQAGNGNGDFSVDAAPENGTNGKHERNGKNEKKSKNQRNKGRTVDFVRKDDEQATVADMQERLRLKLGHRPIVDDCIARASRHKEGSDAPDREMFMRRFLTAFLIHKDIKGIIGTNRRWMRQRLKNKFACLEESIWEKEDFFIDADGLLGRLIGEGSFSKVYEVVMNGKEYAVKFFDPQPRFVKDVDRARDRFFQEIQRMELVGGEGAPRLVDQGKLESGQPYFVMEMLRGWTLQQILDECGTIPPQAAYDIATLIAADLVALHKKKIIHRDFKPGNVMLTHDGSVVIIDLGLGRFEEQTGDRLTVSQETFGTPSHMPPEQVENPKHASAKGDGYALGVILYEMLTGRLPFRAQTQTALLQKQKTEKPDLSTVPGEHARAVLAGLLEKDPDRRMSADDALGELFEHSSFKTLHETVGGLPKSHKLRRMPGMPLSITDPLEVEEHGSVKVPYVEPNLTKYFSSIPFVDPPPPSHGGETARLSTTPDDADNVPDKAVALPAWYKRPRPLVGATGAAALAFAGLIYGLTRGEQDDGNAKAKDLGKDKTGVVKGPSGQHNNIDVPRKGQPSISFIAPEKNAPSAIKLFSQDAKKSITILEGVLFRDSISRQLLGAASFIRLNDALKDEIRKKHGDLTGQEIIAALEGAHIYRYERTINGKAIHFMFLSGTASFLEDGIGCVAYAADPNELKNGPFGTFATRIVKRSDEGSDQKFKEFFSGLDLSSVSSSIQDGGMIGNKDIATLERAFRNEAKRRNDSIQQFLRSNPKSNPTTGALFPGFFRGSLDLTGINEGRRSAFYDLMGPALHGQPVIPAKKEVYAYAHAGKHRT